jgi:dihydrofolate reductase
MVVGFSFRINSKSMKITAIVATSLDGYITKHDSEGATFTSKADQMYFREVLKSFDCSVMGAATFEASKDMILKSPHLERLRVVWTRNPEKYAAYERAGRLEFSANDLKSILADLEQRGKQHCAILGGSSVYSECLRQGLLDELWVTLEPLVFGDGKKLATGILDVRLELLSTEHLAKNTLLLKYKPVF